MPRAAAGTLRFGPLFVWALIAFLHSLRSFGATEPVRWVVNTRCKLKDKFHLDDSEAEKPRWMEINTLTAQEFYNDGEMIMDVLTSKDQQPNLVSSISTQKRNGFHSLVII